MNVNWCMEHLCGNLPNRETEGWASVPGQRDRCFFAEEFGAGGCRMVRMELTPLEPISASYDIEIPDFINQLGVW